MGLKLKDIYYFEPRFVEKSEIKVVGVADLFVNNIGINTKKRVPDLNDILVSKTVSGAIRNVVDEYVTIGLQNDHFWPSFIQNPPVFYHMASYEVSDFHDVPEDSVAMVIPASKYAVFSCESSFDPNTKKPLKQVDWDPLFGHYYGKWRLDQGVREKGYYLEISYYWRECIPGMPNGGYPIYKFELWVAIE